MYERIENWLNTVLAKPFPKKVVAVGFNLYEDDENEWSMEVVGASRFDPQDDDWLCEEVTDFDTREDPLAWTKAAEWDEVHREVAAHLKKYLQNGLYADKLRKLKGVAVGFVDGDLEIL